MKLVINCNKVFVLPETDGPIINILNGQSSFYSHYTFKELNFVVFSLNIFYLGIPTDPFEYF